MNRKIEDIYFNLDFLKNSTLKLINGTPIKDLLANDVSVNDEERYEVFVDTISSGSAGIYQAEYILQAFGFEKANQLSKEEFVWERIDKVANELADDLNKKLKLDYHNGRFYFGHLEVDGSYGLFYTWDKMEEKRFGFIPDACRKCDSFILHEPCAYEWDCERIDSWIERK